MEELWQLPAHEGGAQQQEEAGRKGIIDCGVRWRWREADLGVPRRGRGVL